MKHVKQSIFNWKTYKGSRNKVFTKWNPGNKFYDIQVTSFTIAVNRPYKTKDSDEWKEETYFFDVEAFGALAERLGRQLNKGTQVLIEGQLRQDRWETASGDKRTKVKIVADRVNLIGGRPSERPPEKEEEPELSVVADTEDFSSDEDVPF